MADCASIKIELDAATAILDRLIQPGVRAVQDSDGSRIEYTMGNVNAQKAKVALLQAQYDACVNGSRVAMTRPINFIF